MSPLLAILAAVGTTAVPFIALEAVALARDAIVRRKARDMNPRQAEQLLKDAGHVAALNELLSAALHDQRLAGKKTPIMIPDKAAIKEMEAKGQTVDEDSKPMKQLTDDGGRPQYEFTSEKWDPRFDQFDDGKPDPIMSRIYIDPGKGAPTVRRIYFILLSLAVAVGSIAAMIGVYPALAVSFGLSVAACVLMKKRGQECLDSTKLVWEKLEGIYTSCVGPIPAGQTIRDVVTVNEWAAIGDDQYESNAKTYAGEHGLSRELEEILPKADPKTGKKKKPRRAVFRDVPCSVTMTFKTGFGLQDSQRKNLLDNLNLNIGGGKVEWVAKKALPQKDGTVRQVDGWDFDAMRVDLMTLPPLPTRAMLPEDIDETPWNVIRLGRSVDGEVVWDLSGQGWGYLPRKNADGTTMRDSYGMPVFPSKGDPDAVPDNVHHAKAAGITCPMSLVPLDVDTLVWTLEEAPVDGETSTAAPSDGE